MTHRKWQPGGRVKGGGRMMKVEIRDIPGHALGDFRVIDGQNIYGPWIRTPAFGPSTVAHWIATETVYPDAIQA